MKDTIVNEEREIRDIKRKDRERGGLALVRIDLLENAIKSPLHPLFSCCIFLEA